MNPLTLEWIAKAEGDYVTMQREFEAQNNPNYDGVCFHAQQCAEKYFKAYLQEIGAVIERSCGVHCSPPNPSVSCAAQHRNTARQGDTPPCCAC